MATVKTNKYASIRISVYATIYAAIYAAIIFFAFCAVSCSLWGLIGSTDLDIRLKDKNTFNFLHDDDLNIKLPDEYSFVVLSDPHITSDFRGLENIASIFIGTDKFIVVDGDISDNGDREYLQKFIDAFKDLKSPNGERVPCYPALGNHDIFSGNWEAWRKLIGSSCYTAGGADSSTLLIVLDSASAFLGAYQLDFLDAELARGFRRKFIFTHTSLFINPEVDVSQLTDWTDINERAKFVKIASGRASAVIMGHLHIRVEKEAGGVPYIALDAWKDGRTFLRVFVSNSGIRYEFKTSGQL